MRIIQLIDSLEAGGAERMAVNYANALTGQIEFSGLVTTRKEGALLNQIDSRVSYLFLNKKRKLDFGALFRLRSFVLKNKVAHIHAHSSSFFLALLLKILLPYVKLIWHYHYGNNEILSKRKVMVFKISIPFFYGVIAVNQKLKIWIVNNLKSKNTIYLPNFPEEDNVVNDLTPLNGVEGKRIISLANLREDKNHFLLIEVAQKLKKSYPDWTFHLVGKDFDDCYSKQIKKLIQKQNLENNVFLYGSRQDVGNILHQASIAVLTSKSEGLPVSLLEYGLYKKAVVVTDVGAISTIVQNQKNGFIVESNNSNLVYDAIIELIGNETLQSKFGQALYDTIEANYSAKNIIKNYLIWLQAN